MYVRSLSYIIPETNSEMKLIIFYLILSVTWAAKIKISSSTHRLIIGRIVIEITRMTTSISSTDICNFKKYV